MIDVYYNLSYHLDQRHTYNKVIKLFNLHHVRYRINEIDTKRHPLTYNNLLKLSQNTDNGIFDLINQHAKLYSKLSVHIWDMTTTQLLKYLVAHQHQLLPRLVITDGNYVTIGSDMDEIYCFVKLQHQHHILTAAI